MERRWAAIAALSLLLHPATTGCARQGDPGRVVVYTPARGDLPGRWASRFEEKTGIRVDQVIAGTNEIYGKLVAERARPRADLWIKGGGFITHASAAQEGLFRPYRPLGWEHMPERKGRLLLRDRDWNWVGTSVLGLGIAYNPTLLPESALPRTWEDLADPKWRGEIEMWDPAMSGTATLFVLAALQRYGEESGWKYLKNVFRNLHGYTRTGAAAFKVARGEVKLAIHFEYQVIQYRSQIVEDRAGPANGSLAFYLPPGSPVVIDPMAQMAGAPHPSAGERFADFILSPEGQELLRANGLVPVADLIAGSERPSRPAGGRYTVRDLEERAQELDPAWMAENVQRALERWKAYVEASK